MHHGLKSKNKCYTAQKSKLIKNSKNIHVNSTIDCFVDALQTNKRSEEWKNQNNIFTWLSSLRTVWLHFWWKMVTATHNYSSILHWLSYQLSHYYIQYNLCIHDHDDTMIPVIIILVKNNKIKPYDDEIDNTFRVPTKIEQTLPMILIRKPVLLVLVSICISILILMILPILINSLF